MEKDRKTAEEQWKSEQGKTVHNTATDRMKDADRKRNKSTKIENKPIKLTKRNK